MDGWPADALAVLERAETCHGGADRFARVRSIRGVIESLGGPLMVWKGLGKTFGPLGAARIEPHEGRVVFAGYAPDDGDADGVFDRGTVRLIAPDGEVRSESVDHRARMPHPGRWTPLDGLYFFGYALVTYFSLPFILRRCRYLGVRRWRGMDGLTVEFPADFPTHSRRQSFFFGADGRLARHDYTAEVVGSWATGAHLTSDYVEAGGLWFPTRRRVIATLFGRPLPIPILSARVRDIEVVT